MNNTDLPNVSGFSHEDLFALLSADVGPDAGDVLAYAQDVSVVCGCCGERFLDFNELIHANAREFREVDGVDGWVCHECEPELDDDYLFDASFDAAQHYNTWSL